MEAPHFAAPQDRHLSNSGEERPLMLASPIALNARYSERTCLQHNSPWPTSIARTF